MRQWELCSGSEWCTVKRERWRSGSKRSGSTESDEPSRGGNGVWVIGVGSGVQREGLKRRKNANRRRKKSIAWMTWDKKDGRIEDCQPSMGEKDEKRTWSGVLANRQWTMWDEKDKCSPRDCRVEKEKVEKLRRECLPGGLPGQERESWELEMLVRGPLGERKRTWGSDMLPIQ
jgi:hypothetical protein